MMCNQGVDKHTNNFSNYVLNISFYEGLNTDVVFTLDGDIPVHSIHLWRGYSALDFCSMFSQVYRHIQLQIYQAIKLSLIVFASISSPVLCVYLQ